MAELQDRTHAYAIPNDVLPPITPRHNSASFRPSIVHVQREVGTNSPVILTILGKRPDGSSGQWEWDRDRDHHTPDVVRILLEQVIPDSEGAVRPEKTCISADDIERYRLFSYDTFGPDCRTEGVLSHIGEEVEEVRDAPEDTEEWMDIIILSLDGSYRHGASPQKIVDTYHRKCEKNFRRKWQNWRELPEGVQVKHIKENS